MRGKLAVILLVVGCGRSPARPTVEGGAWRAAQALGPFASREDFCRDLAVRRAKPGEAATWCHPAVVSEPGPDDRPSTALHETEVTAAGWRQDNGVRYESLFVTLQAAD